MTSRRTFLTLLGGSAATWPMAARGQPAAMPVIGYLGNRSFQTDAHLVAEFRRGLAEAGYVEGRNVTIEFRWAESQLNRLPELAADLVKRQVTLIATAGSFAAPRAVKAATTTIPIVFSMGDDPVKAGIVASLNKPGEQITGVTTFAGQLGAKRLGLLQELVPKPTIIAFLLNPESAGADLQTADAETSARDLGLRLLTAKANSVGAVDEALKVAKAKGANGLLVSSAVLGAQRNQIVAMVARHGLPAIWPFREFADAGGLMSYGGNFAVMYRQLGVYAGRILRGDKPGDLPVQQPTRFELVINLNTAKSLGLEFSPQLLALADEVIE